MITTQEIRKIKELSGLSMEKFSRKLGRTDKYVYVILNQYKNQPYVGKKSGALIVQKYPGLAKQVIDEARFNALQRVNTKKVKAGRKPGANTRNTVNEVFERIKKENPKHDISKTQIRIVLSKV